MGTISWFASFRGLNYLVDLSPRKGERTAIGSAQHWRHFPPALVRQISYFLGSPENLRKPGRRTTQEGSVHPFVQRANGMIVVGGQVSFRFKHDRLFVIGSEALPNVTFAMPFASVGEPPGTETVCPLRIACPAVGASSEKALGGV